MARSKLNPQVSRAPFVPVAGHPAPSWPGYLGLVALTFLVYGGVLSAGFVWNDLDYVTKPELRSLHGLWQIWTWPLTVTGGVGATEQYYPLLHSVFWLQHKLWGDSATGYHVFNVLLHAACACLLVAAIRRLLRVTGDRLLVIGSPESAHQSPVTNHQLQVTLLPWLAGVLFAVHPVYVESVAWISEQKNTLSLLFYLLAGIAYLRFAESKAAGPAVPPYPGSEASGAAAPVAQSAGPAGQPYPGSEASGAAAPATKAADQFYPGSEGTGAAAPVGRDRWARRLLSSSYLLPTFLFVCAILSKSLTASLPAALLVVLWWRRGRLDWRRDWVPLIPWFVLGALAGGVTGWVERNFIGAQGEDFALGFVERGVLAGRVIWFYIAKFYWPADLVFIYPRWEIDSGSAAHWLFPVAAVGLLAGLWLVRRRARGPLAAYLFFTGSLFPTMGFFNVYAFKFSYVADHWNYLPSLGLLVGGAWVVVALVGRFTAEPAAPGGAPARTTLYTAGGVAAVLAAAAGIQAARQTPGYSDLETFYRTILRDNPVCWLALNNLGKLETDRGRPDAAIPYYAETMKLRPKDPEPRNNVAVALMNLGRHDEAAAYFREAIRMQPNYADAYYNQGNLFANMGRWEPAVASYETALRLKPGNPGAANNLGVSLLTLNRPRDAIPWLEEALRLRPGYPEAHFNLGRAHLAEKRFPDAIAWFEKAVALRPGSAEYRLHHGLALMNAGRPADAIAIFERVIEALPESSDARLKLAAALVLVGREREAAEQHQLGLQLRAAGK